MGFGAIVIDDEPLAIEALCRFCERSGEVAVLGQATSGAAGLDLAHAVQPDVVFLDIGMPGLSGLEVARRFATFERGPLIVFVTAFDHFATEAFDLSVADYLLKPLEPQRFARAIQKIIQLLPSGTGGRALAQEFWLPHRGTMMRVSASSIRRVDAERDYVRLGVDDRSYFVRDSIFALEKRLDPARYIRIHRSTILRTDTIAGFRHLGAGAWAAIDDRDRVNRIGRSYIARVRHALAQPCGSAV